MGISRYYSATNTPPNKPKTLQNLYSPRRGELAIIPGVSALASDIPGIDFLGIQDMQFLDQTIGEQGWLVKYDWDTTLIPTSVSGGSYSSPTGTPSGNRDLVMEWVMPGGTTKISAVTSVTYGTSGGEAWVDATIPTSIPDYVYSINYYIRDASGDLILWAGSVSRKDGIFPPTSNAESTIRLPLFDTSPTSTNNAVGSIPPSGFSTVPTSIAGGNLDSGRIYYFGIVPYIVCKNASSQGPRFNRTWLYSATSVSSQSSNIYAAFVPDGYNALNVTFTGVPTSTGDSTLETVTHYQIFAGVTPEDLAPVGDNKEYQARPVIRSSTTVTATIKTLPYNTNMQMSMNIYSGLDILGVAIANRYYGSWTYQDSWDNGLGYRNYLARDETRSYALANIQLPYSMTSHREMLPGSSCFLFDTTLTNKSLTSYSTVRDNNSTNIFLEFREGSVRAASYEDRMYYADGVQSPFKCNGYIVNPLIIDDVTRVPVITNNIILFKDKLCLFGGGTNWSYDKGNIFYSNAANPNNFGTGAGNFLNINFGDASDIVGGGVYSRDLSNTGPATFLVVGKANSTYSWNGGTTAADQSLVQIGKSVGWLSANSFALTAEGAVVATNQGLYGVTGSDMQPIDPGTEIFYQSATENTKSSFNLVFNGDRLIVGYEDPDDGPRELWYDFRRDPEGMVIVATGPHIMQEYDGQAVAQRYGAINNYRVSYYNGGFGEDPTFYRRDIPGTFTNVGAAIDWMIELNETGLGADEFVKIMTRMYMRAKINKQETVTITMPSYDSASDGQGLDYTGSGLQTVSSTLVMPYTGVAEIYRLFQKVFTARYRGAIFTPKFQGSTNVDFRIVSISLLYQLVRRRLL